MAVELERVAAGILGPKGIYPNVDFYSGIVYQALGIPRDLFTPIFAIARVAGWLSHWLEQLKNNRIYPAGADLRRQARCALCAAGEATVSRPMKPPPRQLLDASSTSCIRLGQARDCSGDSQRIFDLADAKHNAPASWPISKRIASVSSAMTCVATAKNTLPREMISRIWIREFPTIPMALAESGQKNTPG